MRIFRPLVEFTRRLFGAETRAVTSVPWNQGGPLASHVSTDRALTLIPFFACVRLLAEQVSSLPLHAYRRDRDERVRIADPPLLRSPSALGTSVRWLRQLVISLAVRGNAYGLVTGRDGFGFVTSIEWLHPDEVFCDDTKPAMPVYYWLGTEIPRERIVHIPWFTLPGRVVALSPVSAFAASIGVGLNATTYGATWFENGGIPPGTFKNTAKTLDPDHAESISDRLMARIRRGRPLVYGSDWDFTALQVNPEEAQFLGTIQANATQIASIFGIPPEWVGGQSGGSLTYNSPEQNGLQFLKMALRPWLVLIETELSKLLPERQYVQFNVDAVVRADLATRYTAYQTGLEGGWLTVNEVRALEDLPPLPGGDRPRPKPRVAQEEPRLLSIDPGRVNGHLLDTLDQGGPRG